MKRKGSPWTGIGTVLLKESADHLTSARMRFLEILVFLAALGAVYAASQRIRDTTGQDPFVLLRLYTTAQEPFMPLVTFLSLLVPLVAIALGFDAVNTEHARRTLSRILAQPIYRDALLMGKLLAALLTLALLLLSLWLLIAGLGILFLGVPPSGEEILRSLAYLLATLAYGGVWLTLAMMCSVLFRQPATSALAALAIWLVFTVFWPILSGLGAQAILSQGSGVAMAAQQSQIEQLIGRISPNMLYGEVTLALLSPELRSLGPVFLSQLEGALMGAPLPFVQSLLLVWPHLAGLVSAVVLLFTGAYLAFQRQEVRA
jgi:ABC-2 type transport system permease protein